MNAIRRHDRTPLSLPAVSAEQSDGALSMLEVVWRRRGMALACIAAFLAAGAIYLLFAPRVYSASAKVVVEQNEPLALNESRQSSMPSESFVQTQADVFTAAPVLSRALQTVHWRDMKTFASAGDDPVGWIQRGNGFRVDVARKSDVITVTMDSAYPQEAADFVNAIVAAFMADRTAHKQSSGAEMVRALNDERTGLKARLDECLANMTRFKQENNVLSFGNDKANTAMERDQTLASSLTTAEMATIDLRAQAASIQAALADPLTLQAFVEAQQFKNKDTGDHEYDDLRSELAQQQLQLSTYAGTQGSMNARVQTLESVVASLRARIAEKERSIANAHLVSIRQQLTAAESREMGLRQAAAAQRSQLVHLSPKASEYAKLEADVARLQKEQDLIDARIAEVKVNDLDSAPLNVQVVESSHAPTKPTKPSKMLTMCTMLAVGWVVGITLALLSEWRDARLHSPAEILTLLRTPVVAAVPPLNARLSPVARGQILHLDAHSPAAEAYRSIRTSLHLGPFRDARTIVLASPGSGDGKSTTVSNLAIAFAQAGQRTLIVDCDLRGPVQHLIFETSGAVGLTSVIAGEEKLSRAIRPTCVANLHLLPCGPIPAHPSELLAGKRFSQLMRTLLGTFDRIIIDSPPLSHVADARILAAGADATLLVLRMNQSARKSGLAALDSLDRAGANVLGAVANDMASPREKTYEYYRGSWQSATSPRRVMASVAGALDDANPAPAPAHEAAHADVGVEEPDWTADGDADVSVNSILQGANGNGNGASNGNGHGNGQGAVHASGNGNGNGHAHGHAESSGASASDPDSPESPQT